MGRAAWKAGVTSNTRHDLPYQYMEMWVTYEIEF